MTSTKLLFILAGLIGGIALTFLSVDQLGQITYRLEWEWGEAQPLAQGWTVTNDLGYQIHLTQGYLVTYSAELIPCQTDDDGPVSFLDTLDTFGPQPAYAGHGTQDNDSRLTASYIEDLSRPVPVTVETITVTPHRYCQVHYLIGPARPETTQNLPQTVEMVGQSLFLEGTYLAPGAEIAIPFTIKTHFPDGVISDLRQVTGRRLQVTTNGGALTIVIRRRLDTMFSGVDFGQMSAADQARAILRALTDSTQVSVLADA